MVVWVSVFIVKVFFLQRCGFPFRNPHNSESNSYNSESLVFSKKKMQTQTSISHIYIDIGIYITYIYIYFISYHIYIYVKLSKAVKIYNIWCLGTQRFCVSTHLISVGETQHLATLED